MPSAIRLPWSITAIRSARRSASSRYWVVSRTVEPCRDARPRSPPRARSGCAGRARWSARRGTAPAGARRARRRGRGADACRPSRSSRAGRRRRRGRSARAARGRARDDAWRPRWYSRPTMSRFSKPVRFSSTAAYWPARPIRERSARRIVDHVEARDPGAAAARRQERRQDPHGGRLTGPVRAQQPEHGPGLDPQVDAAQRLDVAVGLAQPLSLNCPASRHALQVSDPGARGRSISRSLKDPLEMQA